MTITHKLDKRNIYQKLFRVINAMQSSPTKIISQSEIDMLVEVLVLPYKFRFQRFSILAKRKARASAQARGWNITPENFNNKVYSLVDKGILDRDEDGLLGFGSPYNKIIDDVEEALEAGKPWMLNFKFIENVVGETDKDTVPSGGTGNEPTGESS
jgi:hypothetical protein